MIKQGKWLPEKDAASKQPGIQILSLFWHMNKSTTPDWDQTLHSWPGHLDLLPTLISKGLPWLLSVKNLPTLQETQEMWVQSLGREDPQRRKWQLTPVFLPGKSHGKRNMAGYSPWGCKESDTTEQLSISSFPKWHELMMPLSYGSQRVQWFRNRNHEGHKEESIWTLDYLDAPRGRC